MPSRKLLLQEIRVRERCLDSALTCAAQLKKTPHCERDKKLREDLQRQVEALAQEIEQMRSLLTRRGAAVRSRENSI